MAVDTLDVVSHAIAKEIIREGSLDVTRTEVIERAVTGLSRRLDELVGPVVVRTVTDELHDGGRPFIRLREAPATSITTLVEAQGTSTTTLTAETFGVAGTYLAEVTDAGVLSGRLIRRTSFCDYRFPVGRRNVKVTYEAGRYATTAAVDGRYQEAMSIMLLNWFRAHVDSVGQIDEYSVPHLNFPTFAIPMAVLELLGDQVRPVVA